MSLPISSAFTSPTTFFPSRKCAIILTASSPRGYLIPITLSNLPDLTSESGKLHLSFTVARTNTPRPLHSSICVWTVTYSSASLCTGPSFANLSMSSRKTMHGASDLAFSNTFRIWFTKSPSGLSFLRIKAFLPLSRIKHCAISVLPNPGSP